MPELTVGRLRVYVLGCVMKVKPSASLIKAVSNSKNEVLRARLKSAKLRSRTSTGTAYIGKNMGESSVSGARRKRIMQAPVRKPMFFQGQMFASEP